MFFHLFDVIVQIYLAATYLINDIHQVATCYLTALWIAVENKPPIKKPPSGGFFKLLHFSNYTVASA
jgi:hypothetical protein